MSKCRPKYATAQLEKNCQVSNLRRIKQLHFITSRTQIPTQHVLRTTKDLDKKGLKGGGSGAPRSTTPGETHDGQKTLPVSGVDIVLQNPPLDSPRSMTMRRHAQNPPRYGPLSETNLGKKLYFFNHGRYGIWRSANTTLRYNAPSDQIKALPLPFDLY